MASIVHSIMLQYIYVSTWNIADFVHLNPAEESHFLPVSLQLCHYSPVTWRGCGSFNFI